MSVWQDIRYRFYQTHSQVVNLIYINVAVFLCGGIVSLFTWLFRSSWDFSQYFKLPAGLILFLKQPWSIVSYQFLHLNILHILFNMMWLYVFGKLLEDLIGGRHIWRLYLLGGISGGLLYMGAYNLFPVFDAVRLIALCWGASASVMAIMVATAVYMPNYDLFLFGILKIKIKWLVTIFVAIDILTMSNGNAGGHIAHLGGALFGWLYVVLVLRGNFRFPEITLFKRQAKRPVRNFKVEINKNPKAEDKRKVKPSQEDVDAILDKISRSGYDRLTKEEKDILFKASEK